MGKGTQVEEEIVEEQAGELATNENEVDGLDNNQVKTWAANNWASWKFLRNTYMGASDSYRLFETTNTNVINFSHAPAFRMVLLELKATPIFP